MTESATHSTFEIAAKPDAPIACDMTTAPDTPQERVAEYGRLFAHALEGRERTPSGVVFRFAAKPGVFDWLSDLAQREAACCPFFAFEVRAERNAIVWSTSGDPSLAVQTFLDEFYALPEHVAEGFDGMLDRLAKRGVAISRVADRRFTLDEQRSAPGILGKIKAACGC